MVYKFFDKKSSGSGFNTDTNNESLLDLAEELRKSIIRKFEKTTAYSCLKDNIWGVYLADIQLISRFIKEFIFLLSAIDIFNKYVWVVLLKDKKGVGIVNAFQKIVKKSNQRKPNKVLVEKGSEFYSNSFKTSLKDNDIKMYSIHNEGKSVVAERFIRTLKP